MAARITLAQQVAALTSLVESLVAAQAAPAKAKAASPAPTFATKADILAGGGFPCTATDPCSRSLRTAKRASTHGVDAGGHEPR